MFPIRRFQMLRFLHHHYNALAHHRETLRLLQNLQHVGLFAVEHRLVKTTLGLIQRVVLDVVDQLLRIERLLTRKKIHRCILTCLQVTKNPFEAVVGHTF